MLTDQRTPPSYVPLPDQDADLNEVRPEAHTCRPDTRWLALAASWLSVSLVLLVAVGCFIVQLIGNADFATAAQYLYISPLAASSVISTLLAGTVLLSTWPGDARGRTAVRVMAVACAVLDLVQLLMLDATFISAVRECRAQAAASDCTSGIIIPAIISNMLLLSHAALSALVGHILHLRSTTQEQGPEWEELAQRPRAHAWCSGGRVLPALWLTVSLVLLGGLVVVIWQMWEFMVAHGHTTPAAEDLQMLSCILPLAISVLCSIVLASAALVSAKQPGSPHKAQTLQWVVAVACALLSGLQMLLADGYFSVMASFSCSFMGGSGPDCWKIAAAAAAVSTTALLAHIILSCLQARCYLLSRTM